MTDTNFWLGTSLGIVGFTLLIIWSMIWKGIALWKAGQNNHLGWFVVMFIINTAGILEILYIFIFSKRTHNR